MLNTGSKLRRDFLTGDWVAIAPARAERPVDSGHTHDCPFCPNNEHMTPPEIYRNGDIRVFANKYPAVVADCGAHEVLVDTASHDQRLHEMSPEHICEIFLALQLRLNALSADKRIEHVQIFKNQGRTAGATLSHSHWQIVATPVTPLRQLHIQHAFEEYFRENNKCYLCNLFSRDADGLTVYENAAAISYVPAAAAYSDGIHIAPKQHINDFASISPEDMLHLADALKRVLTALIIMHPKCGYNICLQSIKGAASHFYIEIIPRLGRFGGFELSTGCYINSTDPFDSVKRFKNIVCTQ